MRMKAFKTMLTVKKLINSKTKKAKTIEKYHYEETLHLFNF